MWNKRANLVIKGQNHTYPAPDMTKSYLRLYFVLMAKQPGDIFIEGTIDDLTFYKMDGKYYVRMKSSLNKSKFWKNKAFDYGSKGFRFES